jgi:hypothetical protein
MTPASRALVPGVVWLEVLGVEDEVAPAVAPPRVHAADMASEIESPVVAEAVGRRLGLRMSPDKLLGNLTVNAHRWTIRLTYRDPGARTPQRARRVVRTVAVVAGEHISARRPPTSTTGCSPVAPP